MDIAHVSDSIIDPSDPMLGMIGRRLEQYLSLSQDYHTDPKIRALAENDPNALLEQRGVTVGSDVDVRIVVNTDEVFHVVFPPDPNMELMDEQLGVVAGGKGNCAGSGGTASTVSTFATSLGCASTASTAGSQS